MPVSIAHRRIDVDGVDVFYREAGPPEAPVALLPYGYPCSSSRLVAPDLPGFG